MRTRMFPKAIVSLLKFAACHWYLGQIQQDNNSWQVVSHHLKNLLWPQNWWLKWCSEAFFVQGFLQIFAQICPWLLWWPDGVVVSCDASSVKTFEMITLQILPKSRLGPRCSCLVKRSNLNHIQFRRCGSFSCPAIDFNEDFLHCNQLLWWMKNPILSRISRCNCPKSCWIFLTKQREEEAVEWLSVVGTHHSSKEIIYEG